MEKNISLIAALSKNLVIGQNNTIPWKIPSDLRRFKELTTGNTIIMGRKTFESLSKPLPNRDNFVISNTIKKSITGIYIFPTIEKAIKTAILGDVFIIGGSQIYAHALPHVKKLFLSFIDVFIEQTGDISFFPKINFVDFNLDKEEQINQNGDQYKYSYKIYTKI